MPAAEFAAWRAFYVLYPFDDFHRFHRPAALVASAKSSKDRSKAIEASLAWLQPDVDTQVPAGNWSDADIRTMRALGFKPQKAIGNGSGLSNH